MGHSNFRVSRRNGFIQWKTEGNVQFNKEKTGWQNLM
jgi:hypothetical protein